jgi:uncharacterized membrane protein
MLEHYERTLPGAADRILRLAELQAGHRRHIESVAIESDVRRAARGQKLGFILALAIILGGLTLIASGRPAEGLASVIFATASLVAVFVVSKYADSRTRERKRLELGTVPARDE